MSDYQTLLPLAATITTLGGAWLTVRKIAKDATKSKKELVAEILHAAKEEDAIIKAKLEAKIQSIQSEVDHLQADVIKDIEHLKETYNGEIRNLGQKIEELRSELKNQHGQLVQLLTEMIKKKS